MRVIDSAVGGLDVRAAWSKVRTLTKDRRVAVSVTGLLTAMLVALSVAALSLAHDVYTGGPEGLAAKLSASCVETGGARSVPCSAELRDLGQGRNRIAVYEFAGKDLLLTVEFADTSDTPHALMLRPAVDRPGDGPPAIMDVTIVDNGVERSVHRIVLETPAGQGSSRELIPLPRLAYEDGLVLRISISGSDPLARPTVLLIDELGFFTSTRGLTKDERLFFSYIPDERFYSEHAVSFLRYMALIVLLLLLVQSRRRAVVLGLLYVTLFSITSDLLFLRTTYAPEWSVDLRVAFASGPLQEDPGSNLNAGLYMAQSVLKGNGPLLADYPPWHRMPGQAFFLALAGHADDLLRMAVNAIFLQVALKALAVGYFFLAAVRLMRPVAAAFITTLVVVLPTLINHLLIESIIPSIVLVNAASAILFLTNRDDDGHVPLPYHVLLHASFALWFLMRPDVVPGWAVVSLVLYLRSVRSLAYLMIPIGFYLLIGVSWALFKQQYTGEWSMTTNSVGASAMAGLWEAPSKFVWQPEDGVYFRWIADLTGSHAMTKNASSAAMQEVYRFWATYPGYVASLVWHELMALMHTQGFAGFERGVINWQGSRLQFFSIMIATMALSLAIGYRRLQTLLLGWALPFNSTIFFLVYSSAGRFYNAADVALVVTSLTLLTDRDFYRKVLRRPLLSGAVVAVILAVVLFGMQVNQFLLGWDALRYGSPFLDPADSSLSVFKNDFQN